MKEGLDGENVKPDHLPVIKRKPQANYYSSAAFNRCLTKIRTWTGRTKNCSATITP